MAVLADVLSPADIGLPLAYERWRPGQWAIVQGIAESESAYHLLVAPTGFGKSLTYAGISALTGWRTVILTATRALQDQLCRDFQAEMGWIDVRGQSNYECVLPEHDPGMAVMVRKGATVAQAPCRWGYRCVLRDSGCRYYDRIREAARSEVVVTNYDFWMHNRDRIGKVDLLVMDEAHQAPDLLADHLSFRLTADMRRYFNGRTPETDEVGVWAEWAEWAKESIKGRLEGQQRPAPSLLELNLQLGRMAECLSYGEWVVERHREGPNAGSVWFDCIDAERFGRRYLWGDTGRVLMVSATINMMTAAAVGIDKGDVKVWEARSSFPVERRPVWVVDGAPQINFRTDEAHKIMWVNLIDRLIGPRSDRKGIVHTTSFERARYLADRSQHRKRMLLNDSRNTAAIVDSFRKSSAGTVLVSPSVTTGWDFAGEDCEYQVVAKIPFPDLRTKAAQVKAKRNPEWAGYQAAQTIVQSTGRGMRAADDQCETYIVDGNFGWWYGKNWKWTPKWWREAVGECKMGKLPEPLAKL